MERVAPAPRSAVSPREREYFTGGTANATFTLQSAILAGDTTSGAVNHQLPAASSVPAGTVFTSLWTVFGGVNDLSVLPDGTDQIGGVNQALSMTAWGIRAVSLVSNGSTGWLVRSTGIGSLVSVLRTAAPAVLTIAGGVLTTTVSAVIVEGEGAASDNLDTISGLATGSLLILTPPGNGHAITIKHGTGNIECAGAQDVVLTALGDLALLYKYGTNYRVIEYSTTAARGGLFDDDKFALVDGVAPTKRAIFQLVAITAGQTRTVSVPDADVTLGQVRSGARYLSGNLTGTGAPQNQAHGLGAVPGFCWAVISAGHDGAGGAGTQTPSVSAVTADATNLTVTVTAGAKVRLFAEL